VHLHDDARGALLIVDQALDGEHGELDQIGGGSLHRRVDGLTLGAGLAWAVATLDLGQVDATPEQRFDLSHLACRGPRLVHVTLDTGKALEVPLAPSVASAQEAKRKQRVADKVAAMAGAKKGGMDNRPPGGFAMGENRAPLDAWTKLAHALFQTNEAIFLN
jgi:hypothetical protein